MSDKSHYYENLKKGCIEPFQDIKKNDQEKWLDLMEGKDPLLCLFLNSPTRRNEKSVIQVLKLQEQRWQVG